MQVSIDDRPSKTHEKNDTMTVSCAVKEILMEGRCFCSTMADTMNTFYPNKIILIHGSEANTINCFNYLTKKKKKNLKKEITVNIML